MLLHAALLLLAAAPKPAPTRAPEKPAVTAPSPEHAKLVALAGDYDVDLTFRFGGEQPPMKVAGTSEIRVLFDGSFIEERIEGTLGGKPFTTLSWTGYNPFTKQYEATRIASTNVIRIVESGTADASGTLELKAEYPFAGDTWRQRTVVRTTADGLPEVDSFLSFGTTPEWKGVEIRYRKRAKK